MYRALKRLSESLPKGLVEYCTPANGERVGLLGQEIPRCVSERSRGAIPQRISVRVETIPRCESAAGFITTIGITTAHSFGRMTRFGTGLIRARISVATWAGERTW